jgi:hypothetical protein
MKTAADYYIEAVERSKTQFIHPEDWDMYWAALPKETRRELLDKFPEHLLAHGNEGDYDPGRQWRADYLKEHTQ